MSTLAFATLGPMEILLVLVAGVIPTIIACKVCSKVGYHWALGLLALISPINLILGFYIAFAKWPMQRELERLRELESSTDSHNPS